MSYYTIKSKNMKKAIGLILLLNLVFISCKKESNTPVTKNDTIPTDTVIILASGSFVSSAHTTTGIVKVIKDTTNKLYLVFENFKTDNGPDLRTWVSPNNTGNPYIELGLLKAANGNFFYELDPTFNYKTNNRVLIWCKSFSVLFGYAILQ